MAEAFCVKAAVNDSDYNIKQNIECLIDGFVMIMRSWAEEAW